MNVIEFIRTKIFGVSQSEFSSAAGSTQAAVSRWEDEQLGAEPKLSNLTNIRAEAIRRGLPWEDRYFFDPPKENLDVDPKEGT